MANLSTWLETHDDALIRAASLALTNDETLRQTVEIPIIAFFRGVQTWAERQKLNALESVLSNWVSSRSMVTVGQSQSSFESGSLIPILCSIKQATWVQIQESCSPADTIQMLTLLDLMFNEAIQYVARLETDQLISDARKQVADSQAVIQKIEKSKSDFVSVAAHELKTPLTLIEGYMNMMKSDFRSEGNERALMMIGGMAGGTVRLREIIEDMIDVSLIDLKALDLHFQPVWVNRLVDNVTYDMTPTFQQRNIRFEIRKDTITDKPTYADAERIYQVFYKVLSNAIKYTPDGGTVTIAARDLPGFTDLQVTDTGIGIAPEALNRIFEKFSSQAEVKTHSSGKTKFKGGGPGLGLAIAKGIMESHGGSIWAESPGYDEKALPGSTFHIMIPMRNAPAGDLMSELFKGGAATP
jgi:signal transduction histidine kinase